MLLAKIREIDCVGCGKCLAVCPVDAIVGAPKLMYSVLTEECIGCKLCVVPCPMDCIEMVESTVTDNSDIKIERANKAKQRYQARQQRLVREAPAKLTHIISNPNYKSKVKKEIEDAVKRVQERRYDT